MHGLGTLFAGITPVGTNLDPQTIERCEIAGGADQAYDLQPFAEQPPYDVAADKPG